MQCKLCRREMAADEPIYRASVGNTTWREISGYVAEVCAKCIPKVDALSWCRWRAPEPCKTCGRPVIGDRRRKVPTHVVCSVECRVAVYRAIWIARRRSRVERRRCKVCREPFMPKRSDARHCSAACKQKAYRQAHRLAFRGTVSRTLDGPEARLTASPDPAASLP